MAEVGKMKRLNLEKDPRVPDPSKNENNDLEDEVRQKRARIKVLKTRTYSLEGLLALHKAELGHIEILKQFQESKLRQEEKELKELKKSIKESVEKEERAKVWIKRIKEMIQKVAQGDPKITFKEVEQLKAEYIQYRKKTYFDSPSEKESASEDGN